MDTDKLAKLRAIADANPAEVRDMDALDIENYWRKYLDTFNPDVVKAMLDVVDASIAIPRKPSAAHVLMTPGYDELQVALAALAEKTK